ncbi:MAG: carboxypeptidase regulatory-like domain-containing protein [Deltaproteobacteria bacterium]|nr:carboxypeptidase regulatory-like domain-containing protein [Deltaproteobacteria bacterium]
MRNTKIFAAAGVFLLAAAGCSTSVDPTNPYDPSAASEKKAKGNVRGSVALERSDDPSGVLVSLEGTSLTATTGSDGSFTLTGVKEGVYAVLASKEGYRQERLPGVSVAVGVATDLGVIEVLLARGVVAGSVTLAGLQDHGGAVVTLKETTSQQPSAISQQPTAKSQQQSGFRLQASGLNSQLSTSFGAVTGSDGSWQIGEVPAGQYFVVVSKDGFQARCAGMVTIIKDGEQKSVGTLELVSSSALVRFATRAGVDFPPRVDGGGARYFTASRELAAHFTAAGAVRMRTGWSEEETAAAAWESFAVSKDVTIASGEADGEKTLFVELADQCQLSRLYSGAVTLDTAAPADAKIDVDGTVGRGGAKFTSDPGGLVTVHLGATDESSGVDSYRLTVDKIPGDEPFGAMPSTGSAVVPIGTAGGPHTIHVQYRDFAGNEGEAVAAVISLDIAAPSGTVFVVGAAGRVTGTHVDLALDASDGADGSGVDAMMLSNDPAFAGGGWEAFVSARRWVLAEGDDGPRTVYAKFRDVLENEGEAASAVVELVTKGGIKGKVTLPGVGDHSGTIVTVANQNPPVTMTTTGTGEYGFAGLKAGPYSLTFSRTGYREVTVGPITVVAAEDVTVSDVVMSAAKGGATGKATLSGQADHSGVLVSLSKAGYTAHTGADGSYTILDVPVGTYRVRAEKSNWVTAESATDLTVAEGEPTAVPDLLLDAHPGSVSGSVKLEGGAAGSGVTVSVEGGGATTVADGSGAFTLSGVRAGEATLLFTSGTDYDQYRLAGVTVLAGEDTAVGTVTLSRARGTVSGTVALAGSSDASGVTVMAEGSGAAVVTGVTGAFKLDRVPVKQNYTLTAARDGYVRATRTGVDVVANEDTTVGTLTLAKLVGDFLIDGGAEFAKARAVTLDLSGFKDPVTVRASEDPTFGNGMQAFAAWQAAYPFAITTAEDGTKTVFVEYTDTNAQVQGPFSSSIVLDTTAPAVGEVAINDGAALTNSKTVRFRIDGSDGAGGSGLASMQVRNDASFVDADPWSDYEIEVNTWTLADPVTDVEADKDVWVRLRDEAGNIGTAVKGTIRLDTLAPAGTIALSGGAEWTNSVQVTYAVTGASADVVSMALSNTAGGTTVFNAYEAAGSWLLPSGDSAAEKGVFLRLKDAAGNASLETSDGIKLDTTPPPVPAVVPITGTTNQKRPALTFGAVADGVSAVTYEAELSAQADFSTPIACTLLGTGCTPDADLDDDTYYFHVQAADAAGNESGFSSAMSFAVDATAPSAPGNLTGPAALTSDRRPSFSWDTVSDAQLYRVQVSIDPLFATPPPTEAVLPSISWRPPNPLADNLTWYWRVRAIDAATNESIWANGTSFATDATPPGVPSLNQPANGAVKVSASVMLGWDAVTGASQYRVQVASDSTYGAMVVDQTLSQNTLDVSPADGTYYWHVNAIDAAGNQSGFSGSRSFTKDTTPPKVPLPQTPANQARTSSRRPAFGWSDEGDSGAVEYVFFLKNEADTFTMNPIVTVNEFTPAADLADDRYLWTVRSKDANGNESSASAQYRFTVDTAGPAGPVSWVDRTSLDADIQPDNYKKLKTPPLVFQWPKLTVTAPDQGLTYHLEVMDDSGTLLIDEWGIPQPSSGTSVWFGATAGGVETQTYCWRVQAVDDIGNAGQWSASYAGAGGKCTGVDSTAAIFEIDNEPPDVPAPLSPVPYSYVTMLTPDLSWTAEAGSGATQYELTIFNVTDGGIHLRTTVTPGTQAHYTLQGGEALTGGKTYAFSVRAGDQVENWSGDSSRTQFSVDVSPPLDPVTLRVNGIAADPAYVNTPSPSLSWQSGGSTDIDHFEIKLKTDALCDTDTNIVQQAGVESNAFLAAALNDGTYFWCVRAVDRAGLTSNRVLGNQIVVDTVPPTIPRFESLTQTILDLPAGVNQEKKVKVVVLSTDDHFKGYQIRGGQLNEFIDTALDGQDRVTFNLNPDQVNTLQVRAVDLAGNATSADFVIITEDSTPPTPPSNVRVIEGNNSARITWDPSPSPDVAGYKVYYGPASTPPYNGNFVREGVSPIDVGSVTTAVTSFFANLNGSTFYVAVTAYDATQNAVHESSYSTAMSVLPNEVTPEIVGTFDTPGEAKDVSVQDGYMYAADGSAGLRIYDVTNPASPAFVGVYDTPGEAVRVVVLGRNAYVADMATGLLIVDVGNPASPLLIGSYDTPGEAQSFTVRNGVAYLADGTGGLWVIDVHPPQTGQTCPASPKCIGHVDTGADAVYEVAMGPNNVLYSSQTTVRAYDVTDPGSIVEGSPLANSTKFWGMAISHGQLFGVGDNFGLHIWNVTGGPAFISTSDPSSSTWMNNVFISGSHAYLFGDQNMMIIDISDPVHPRRVGFIPDTGTGARGTVSGTHAYHAAGTNGVVIMDIVTPATPRVASTYSNGFGYYGLAVSETVLYRGTGAGVETVSVQNPAFPMHLGNVSPTCAGAFDIKAVDTMVYIACGGSGIRVVDASNPVLPVEVGNYMIAGGSAYKLSVADDLVYVADDSNGVVIIDVSEPKLGQNCPGSSDCVSIFALPQPIKGVHTAGKYLYAVGGVSGAGAMYVVNVNNPVLPSLAGTSIAMGAPEDVTVQGRYAYVVGQTESGRSLSIFDVFDPAAPQLLGGYSSGDTAENVAVAGGLLWYGTAHSLYTVDVSNRANPTLKWVLPLAESVRMLAVEGTRAFVNSNSKVNLIDLEP